MPGNRWIDTTQPQTLLIATILLYVNAVFQLLTVFAGVTILGIALVIGQVAAGYGIANEKKWGYGLGVASAILLVVSLFIGPFGLDLITLMFDVALVALLLHPQSREYQRIWFK